MRKRIYKFPLVTDFDRYVISMPEGATIRHFGVQRGIPTIWAEVDPEAPMQNRYFAIYGTGWGFEAEGTKFIGTVITDNDAYVWHLYEYEGAPK